MRNESDTYIIPVGEMFQDERYDWSLTREPERFEKMTQTDIDAQAFHVK